VCFFGIFGFQILPMKSIRISLALMATVFISQMLHAQKDTAFTRYKNLPLKASRMMDLNTN